MTASSTPSVPAMGLWGNPPRRGKSAVLCCRLVRAGKQCSFGRWLCYGERVVLLVVGASIRSDIVYYCSGGVNINEGGEI